jgi:hypothetical protein
MVKTRRLIYFMIVIYYCFSISSSHRKNPELPSIVKMYCRTYFGNHRSCRRSAGRIAWAVPAYFALPGGEPSAASAVEISTNGSCTCRGDI